MLLIGEITTKYGPNPPIYLDPDEIYDFYKNYKTNYKSKMTVEYGKYYSLNINNYYYSITLGRKVKFTDTLVVKYNCSHGKILFGNLVDVSTTFGPDYNTNNEIEFSENDIISEYEFKDMPIMYFGHKNKFN
jgi:hypothetical protein